MTTRLESIRRSLSLHMLVVVVALMVAPLFGVAVTAAMGGQTLYFLVIGGFIGIFVTLYAPIEVLMLAGFLGAMLADARVVSRDVTYYGRFVPMGMLTVRILLDLFLRRGNKIRVLGAFLGLGLAFVALAAFSTVYSLTPDQTFLRSLSMVFVIVGLGLGLPNYLSTFGKLSRMVKLVIVLIGGFVLLGAVAAPSQTDAVSVEDSFVRIRGFFINPNTQGLMAMLIMYPLVWWWRTEENVVARRVLAGFVVVWALLVLLAGSRASLVGVLVGGIVLGLVYGRAMLRSIPVLVPGIILVGAVLVLLPQFGRSFEFSNVEISPATGDTQQADRAFLIQRAIELGMRSPIVGVGFGASDLVFAQDVPYLESIGVYVAGSHNSYTRMFVDLGIVGLLVGFPIFVVILLSVFLSPPTICRDPTVALMTAAVVSGLVNAFFEDWLFGFGNSSTLPLWFFLALIPLRMMQLKDKRVEQARMETQLAPAEATT